MAKTSTTRGLPAKVKAAPPVIAARKAKTAAATLTKTGAKKAKKPATKVLAPKMTPAPRQAATAKARPSKKAAPTEKRPAPKKAAAAKAAPPGKAVSVKKAAARRPLTRTAVPTPAARRARTAAAPRKAPAAPSPSKGSASVPQAFVVSHLNQDDFKADGLRPYAQYRDLGIAVASSGRCQAHVIRFIAPCTDEVRKRRRHETELQLVYVLQGWMKNEFEGHGEQMMSAGSCWLQPSGIEHTVLDYSADCEVLEIIVPADFKAEDLI